MGALKCQTDVTLFHVAGTDFAALPSNAAAVKAEASHAAIKAKSGTPPPPEQGPLACQVSSG